MFTLNQSNAITITFADKTCNNNRILAELLTQGFDSDAFLQTCGHRFEHSVLVLLYIRAKFLTF
jgi:hypothetical protein